MAKKSVAKSRVRKSARTTMIFTVLNEERNLRSYMNMIYRQTVRPTEVIIVDGGSTDGTIKIINSYQRKYGNIKLISAPGVTIPEAENICIRASKCPVIIGGSAGIEIPSNMIEKLLDALDEKTDVVGGVYRITGDTPMQKAIAEVFQYSLLPDIKHPPAGFLPTNRSLAYRKKKVWDLLGEYPPMMKRSDDTWFGQEALKHGLKIKTMTDSVVTWKARQNLRLVYKYAFLDAESDALMGLAKPRYVRYWIDNFLLAGSLIASLVLLNPLPFLLVLLANAAYLALYSLRVTKYSKVWRRAYLHYAVAVTVLAATLVGIVSGKLKRWKTKPAI